MLRRRLRHDPPHPGAAGKEDEIPWQRQQLFGNLDIALHNGHQLRPKRLTHQIFDRLGHVRREFARL